MVSERVKDWLCRQVWRHAGISAKHSQLAEPYEVEQLDPSGIFLYQVDHPPFTQFHFVAHMVIMRNTLPWERYRHHRHWVFTQQRQHVPTLGQLFKQWLIVLLCRWFKSSLHQTESTTWLFFSFPQKVFVVCVQGTLFFWLVFPYKRLLND